MSLNRSQRHLQEAFRAVTLALVGAFMEYEADPQLIEHVGSALDDVFRTHFARASRTARAR